MNDIARGEVLPRADAMEDEYDRGWNLFVEPNWGLGRTGLRRHIRFPILSNLVIEVLTYGVGAAKGGAGGVGETQRSLAYVQETLRVASDRDPGRNEKKKKKNKTRWITRVVVR
jgi:hypothetical protein